MPKTLTFEEVRKWIIENNENTDWMDTLNRITYPFTSKFRSRQQYGDEEGQ